MIVYITQIYIYIYIYIYPCIYTCSIIVSIDIYHKQYAHLWYYIGLRLRGAEQHGEGEPVEGT